MNIFWVIVLGMFTMHGLAHISGFLTAFSRLPMGFKDEPWIFSKGITMKTRIGKVFGLIWLAALACFLAAAYQLYTHQAAWPGWAVPGAILSLTAILPWAKTVVPGALYGGTIANMLILIGLLGPWKDSIIQTVIK